MAATREDLISDTRAWRGAAARRTATDLTAISASVALFHLAFPGGPAPWAGWVSLVPLCLVLHKRSARDAFTLAFATAFFAWWVSTWWTVPALSLASNADPRLLWPMLAALCGFNALPYALTGLLYARCGWTASGTGALKTALVATVICSLAPSILPGTLAHSQYRESTVIQVVDIAGAAGLFFLMHWFNLSLVAAIVLRSTHPARAMRTLAVAVAVLGGTVLYGHLRVADVERRSSALATARIDVGLVQPNLSVQWRHRDHREAAFERLSRLTDRLIDGPAKPQLVIWPEIPVPLSYVKYPEDRAALDALARSVDVPLMVGGFAPNPQRPGSYYNAVHLLSPHAAVQTYHKQRLLPFGEYLPGEDLFPFLRDLFPHALRYHPGQYRRGAHHTIGGASGAADLLRGGVPRPRGSRGESGRPVDRQHRQ